MLSRADYTKRKQSNQQTQTSSGGLSYDLPNANILYVGIDNELIINAKNPILVR